ncbi:MAG: hypothetical protein L0338_29395 [Acidobacteria bacterium]|nr:hypothetical protein [Acidobacteriota bacterium]
MLSPSRVSIARIARASCGGLIGVDAAAKTLSIPRRAAAVKLAALARRGWVTRVRRGLYMVLPLETEPDRPTAPNDPWVLAREAFSPCYIGGWSAAEHWGLTEQLFRSTLVLTAAHVRSRSLRLLNHEFRLFRVPRSRITGVTLVWRGAERVSVSGRERTIVDGLRSPEICGGMRHLADIMREYGASKDCDFRRLAAVAKEAANGAAWKRLGYLAELLWPKEKALLDEARTRLTAGTVRLDPAVRRRGKLVRRWRVWTNVAINAWTGTA